jgi:hypothetical protein
MIKALIHRKCSVLHHGILPSAGDAYNANLCHPCVLFGLANFGSDSIGTKKAWDDVSLNTKTEASPNAFDTIYSPPHAMLIYQPRVTGWGYNARMKRFVTAFLYLTFLAIFSFRRSKKRFSLCLDFRMF